MVEKENPIENGINELQLWDILSERLKDKYKPKEREWWASTLPYCNRKNIFRKYPRWIRTDLESVVDSYWCGRTELGSHFIGRGIHNLIEEAAKEIAKGIEIPLLFETEGFTIKGKMDMLLEIEGRDVVTEIKTFNDTWGIKYIPNEQHVQQLALYCLMADNWNGLLLYVGRNKGTKAYHKPWKDRLMQDAEYLVQKARQLTVLEEMHVVPDPLPLRQERRKRSLDWECQYCEFRDACWDSSLTPLPILTEE